MSTEQLIAEYRALSLIERRRVAEAILADDDSWIPESFRRGMEDVQQGRTISMETALTQNK